MKHIFFVHSYITYFVAKKIIAEKKLDGKDVILLKERVFDINDPYIEFNHPAPVYKFSVKNILRNWRLISKYDQWIDKITGKNTYILYYPHTELRYMDYLLTNKNCRGYCLMEEGMAAYNKNFKPVPYNRWKILFSVMAIKYMIMYKGRVSATRSFFNDDYLLAYGLSEFAFEGFARRIILERDFSTHLGNSFKIKENDILFLLSCFVETGEINEEKYMELVMLSLEKYFQKCDDKQRSSSPVLYIKPHPRTDINSAYFRELMKRIRSAYSPAIELKLWDNGSVEALLDQKNFVLLAIDTSVILYAAMSHVPVFCFQDIFLPFAKNDLGRRIKDVIPEALSQKIHFIN